MYVCKHIYLMLNVDLNVTQNYLNYLLNDLKTGQNQMTNANRPTSSCIEHILVFINELKNVYVLIFTLVDILRILYEYWCRFNMFN